MTRGGLTRIIDRLVERGWIERHRPKTNRREVHAVLTPAGQQAMTHARTVYVKVLQETLGAHLDNTELEQLSRLTGKLLSALADL